MHVDPNQMVLDLTMAPQPLDDLIIKGELQLNAPEVKYTLYWRLATGSQQQLSIRLDAIWPIDRMSARILNLVTSTHDGGPWERRKVVACLNAIQSAYGCEEPF